MQERLQKIISRAGVASRRKAEELIEQGLVSVNGEVVTELGAKANPVADTVRVRGRVVSGPPPEPLYFMLHKPRGFVVTTEDPEGRRTVMSLMGRYASKVYPVGRLDFHSEGLLLLTNDGELANRVMAAKSQIPKTYHVKVNAALSADQLAKFRRGLPIDGRTTAPAAIRQLRAAANPWYEVTLTEGRNRQIRKMFQALGPLVEKIRRVQVGPLRLDDLPVGSFRPLTPEELLALRAAWDPEARRVVEAAGRRLRPAVRRTSRTGDGKRVGPRAPGKIAGRRPPNLERQRPPGGGRPATGSERRALAAERRPALRGKPGAGRAAGKEGSFAARPPGGASKRPGGPGPISARPPGPKRASFAKPGPRPGAAARPPAKFAKKAAPRRPGPKSVGRPPSGPPRGRPRR